MNEKILSPCCYAIEMMHDGAEIEKVFGPERAKNNINTLTITYF